jgi:hypothetical protein
MEFKEFNPQNATCLNCMIVIGKRSSGKTDLVRNLLPHLNSSCNLIVGGIIKYIDNEETIPEYNEQKVADFISKQKKALRKARETGDTTLVPHACVVFDNYLYSNTWSRSRSIMSLFTNGVCLKTKLILTMQYAIALPPVLRNNIDYVFIFGGNNESHRKRIYDFYAYWIFPSFEEFCQALDKITSVPYTCMVINNTLRSKKLEDNVMWYKANLWEKMVEKKKEELQVYHEELIQKSWHPSRIRNCLTTDEEKEIFGEPEATETEKIINICDYDITHGAVV